jgi:hypothetical protein
MADATSLSERMRVIKTRHGESKPRTPEYAAWVDMISRCYNERHRAYKYYGGRGIGVDPWWWANYENFLSDMGRRPGPGYSLERKKNELGYSKNNCVWATTKAQANNKRSSRPVTYAGRTQTVAQWAEELGMSKHTLYSRLNSGRSVEEAFTAPLQRGRR